MATERWTRLTARCETNRCLHLTTRQPPLFPPLPSFPHPLCAVPQGTAVDMENYFSRLALDIIGKAVFNFDFDSLTHDDPIIQVGAPACLHRKA